MSRLCRVLIFAGFLILPESEISATEPALVISPASGIHSQKYDVLIENHDPECEKNSLAKATLKASAGSGVTASDRIDDRTTACRWSGTLSVGPDAPSGVVNLFLNGVESQPKGLVVQFTVIDEPPQPIPPGLPPSADVTFKVLPRRAASDSFGGRVSKL